MSTICFYHIGDLDGKCSAAIVKHAYNCVVEMYGIDYGWPFPWEKVKGRDVVMVDFSLEPFSDMVRLRQEAQSFIWIDHHKTSIESYAKCLVDNPPFSQMIEGVRVIGKAGCELTWQYFMGEGMPEAVRLLGRYDVWDNKDQEDWETNILPFQYGMRNRDNDPDAAIWSVSLMGPGIHETVAVVKAAGRQILAYENRQNELYVKVCSFETTISEPVESGRQLRVIACNKALTNSQLFDAVWDPEKYDLMAAFYLQKKGTWKVSLYTTRDDVDCSAIAKARGGGGHQKAAGFICDGLPWRTQLVAPHVPQEARKEGE